MSDLIVSVVWLLVLLVSLSLLCLALLVLFRLVAVRLPSLFNVYFLRVPILTVVGIWGFCLSALFLPGARSLLGNAFDLMGTALVSLELDKLDIVSWPMFIFAIKVGFVSLSACLLGSVVMVTWQLVRLYGPKRFFDDDCLDIKPDIKLRHLTIFIPLIALPVVGSAIYRSIESSALPETSWPEVIVAMIVGIGAAGVGLLGSLIFLWFTTLVQLALTRSAYSSPPENTPENISDISGTSPDLFLPRSTRFVGRTLDQAAQLNVLADQAREVTNFIDNGLPEDVKPGYIGHDKHGHVLILSGHGAASIMLALTFALYLFIGFLVYAMTYHSSMITLSFVPTLCYLLLLAMLLCWGFSGLAFFFDRYRLPVLIPVVGLLLIASFFGSDYYYPTKLKESATETTKNDTPSETMIVVAANGGGIQAAGWTARVLTGLEENCQATPGCDQDFGKSIRLISSVSGGSVGTMYFVNEYEKDGTLPEEGLEKIVARAEGSSLDHIAWGLLYPDLARTTVNVLPWAFGLFELDRGRTLDKAWLREDMEWPKREGIEQGLSQWQDDAEAGRRPGVIFNTTIAETGERLPLSTIQLPDDVPGGTRYKQLFENIKPEPMIPVVTAARLSAAFPYVSPAARAEEPAEAQILKDGRHEDHIVDGGYYDNYGTSSLVEWLDWELTRNPKFRPERVLVIQIIASPSVEDRVSHSEEGGFSERLEKVLYQVIAPAETVLNVRGAGQRTHSEVELRLLREKWENGSPCVAIIQVPFRFKGAEPPLSWHLTEEDRREIEDSWQKQGANQEQVARFLTEQGESCG